MKVTCPLTASSFELPRPPQRIVSLVSSATETLEELGLGDRLVGMSKYCSRYVPAERAPVVGEYVSGDVPAIVATRPDLVLVTGGVQAGFARRLVAAGLPVYGLPLPDSAYGILENTVKLGALVGVPERGRAMASGMARRMERLRASAPSRRPRLYTELWFGRHLRTVGCRSFIRDTVELAGAEPLFGDEPSGYFEPDFARVATLVPEAILHFSEEDDHPREAAADMRERGWAGAWDFRLVATGTRRGVNPIHDGPSFLDTAEWLRGELFGA